MQIDLNEDQINHIIYALSELANRRQEQALDYRYNTIAKQANLQEATVLRRMITDIRNQEKTHETKK